MNKNSIIALALREIKEFEILVNGLAAIDQIPEVMFQLSDAKVDNIKNIIRLLSDENETQKNVEQEQTTEKIVVESNEEEITDKNNPIEEVTEIQNQEIEVDIELEIQNIVEPETAIESEIIEDDVIEPDLEPEIIIEKVIETVISERTSIAIEPLTEKKPEKIEKRTIGTIIEKKSSVNERLSEKANNSLDKALINKKITDLKKSINLNDRFRFQKELFKGNASLLNQTLDVLNEAADKNEAMEFLAGFEWNVEEPAVIDFMELVNRKFM